MHVRNKKNRILLLALCLILCFTVVSCKKDSTETPSDCEEEEEARTPIVLPAIKLD